MESLAVSASSTRTRKGVVKYSVVSLRSHSGEASSGYDAGGRTAAVGTVTVIKIVSGNSE